MSQLTLSKYSFSNHNLSTSSPSCFSKAWKRWLGDHRQKQKTGINPETTTMWSGRDGTAKEGSIGSCTSTTLPVQLLFILLFQRIIHCNVTAWETALYCLPDLGSLFLLSQQSEINTVVGGWVLCGWHPAGCCSRVSSSPLSILLMYENLGVYSKSSDRVI